MIPSSWAAGSVLPPTFLLHWITNETEERTGSVLKFFLMLLNGAGSDTIDPPFRVTSPPRVFELNGVSQESVTELLAAWSQGDRSALENLLPLVERELRQIAHRYMRRERPGHTLQTTALVKEAYLRLVDQTRTRWQNRAHFFAVAAQIMRRILLNYARDRAASKRGSGAQKLGLDDVAVISDERAAELLALGEALDSLEKLDPRKSRIVELRYFGGLTVDEIAEVLKLHPDTITREWGRAKAFLRRELQMA